MVRRNVIEFCDRTPNLIDLTARDVVEFSPSVGLVGHDGWADARAGDYDASEVVLSEYTLIAELAIVDPFTAAEQLSLRPSVTNYSVPRLRLSMRVR